MARFVALLRGVNVGTGNRVPMAELKRLLEGLGHADVRTLLNSGNAVFSAARGTGAAHATKIRAGLVEALGVDVPVIVKSAAEWSAIRKGNTLAAVTDDPSRLLVAFTADEPALAGLAAVAPLVKAPERWRLGEYAAYLWCPNGISKCDAAAALLGRLGRAATTRNWATVQKLAALLDGSSPAAAPRATGRRA